MIPGSSLRTEKRSRSTRVGLRGRELPAVPFGATRWRQISLSLSCPPRNVQGMSGSVTPAAADEHSSLTKDAEKGNYFGNYGN